MWMPRAHTASCLAGRCCWISIATRWSLQAAGICANNVVQITRLQSTQRELLTATGTAEIAMAPLHVRNAEITASEITFPAAYSSYMQLFLATTPFNQLATQGKAHARAATARRPAGAIDAGGR